MSGPFGSQQWMYNSGGSFYSYSIGQSLRMSDADNTTLQWTAGTPSSSTTWTMSFWIKRWNQSTNQGVNEFFSAGTSGSAYSFFSFVNHYITHQTELPGARNKNWANQLWRDSSAWYHFVFRANLTEGTQANRLRMYVNGVEYTATSDGITQSTWSFINASGVSQNWGGKTGIANGNPGCDHYLAEINFCDGQSYAPTEFAETKNGIWVAKDTSGLTFGNNGYRLEFKQTGTGGASASTIGADTSGNNNHFTDSGLAASDVVPDSPTNNFCTLNPLAYSTLGTLSEGNLKIATSTNNRGIHGTMPIPTSGKWYWELHVDSYASGGGVYVGFGADASLGYDEVAQSKGVFMSTYNQAVDVNGSTQSSPYNSQGNNSTSNGDIYSFALDVDNQKFYVAKNGTYRGSSDPSAGTGGLDVSAVFTNAVTELTVCLTRGGSYNETYSVNFGQDSKDVASANADENGIGTFEYAPPSGFLALCSANLPQGAIDTLADETPEDYFNTLLWTGDGSNPRTLSGLDFAADFIWHKSRSSASMDHHAIQDVVRGFNTNNNLYTSLTGSETDYPNRGVINSVSSTGFTFNQNASDYSTADGLNQSGSTFVAWNWKAGGAGVSNTDGSISSSVSVGSTSQQSWFSIVGFTTQAGGYTVGHGLGQKPSLIITKNRDTTGGAWYTFTDIIDGSVDYLALNQTTAKLNDPFGMANPTSSVFSLDDDYIFGSGDCIAYCFANAEGLCKVGLYVGNGSSDGSFVYTGFRPAFVLTKKSSASGEWVMWDNRRSGYNVDNDFLYANTNNSEYNGASYPRLDLVSNGFKMRDNSADTNGSGATYIYLAIAEQPFKYANAR